MGLSLTIAGTTITGSSHKVLRESFVFTNELGRRDTVSFSVCSQDQSYVPADGAAVILTDSVLGDLFGGNIRQRQSALRGNDLVSAVGCASWEQLFDRRTTGVRSYRDIAAGDVFSDLIVNTMGGEGITASVALVGPNITLDLDFSTVRQAFDKICELASDGSDTYMWDCLPDKTVRFYRQTSFPAPFDCEDTNHDIQRPITIAASLDDYANRVFVRMGLYVLDGLTNSFTGDAATQSFTLDFPLAASPVITVGGSTQTVGILDSDTGKQWYYRLNSADIVQDPGDAPVGTGVAIDVAYSGYDSRVLPAVQDSPAVDLRSAAEGGTGYYEIVLSLDTPGGTTDASAAANAYLETHARIPASVEYFTQLGGLKAGMYQTVTLPIFSVSATYILQSVVLMFQSGQWVWKVRAVSGALIPDYLTRLRNLSGGSGTASGTASGGGSSTSSLTDMVTVVTANATLGNGPELVEVDTTGGNVTLALPIAANMIGLRKTIYKATGGANTVTIDPAGSETIDGALTKILSTQWEVIGIEGVDATSWKIVQSAVANTTSAPAAPGNFTIGTPTYEYLGAAAAYVGGGLPPKTGGAKLIVTLPVTPPSPIGTTKGGHVFLEIPDQSSTANVSMDGSTQMGDGATMQGPWSTIDLGQMTYDAGADPWTFGLDLRVTSATVIRIYVSPYSNEIDTPLVQAGLGGATPSVLLTINPFQLKKPGSGSNVTTQLVPSITAAALTNVSVKGVLQTPIAVTVDFSSFPAEVDEDWGFQILGYQNDDLTTDPVLVSGYLKDPLVRTTYIVPAGPDGITAPHTFGPETPTSIINVTVYAVAGLFGAHTVNGRAARAGTFVPNNVVKGITASASISYGTATGVLFPTQLVQALLDTSVGVNNAVFGVLPQGIDNARIALLAVDTAQLAALAVAAAKLATGAVTTPKLAALAVDAAALAVAAVTTPKLAALAVDAAALGTSAVTSTKIASLAVGTAAIQTGAITTALIGTGQITTALIGTGQITSALIGSAAIGTAAIQTAAITTALIQTGNITFALMATAVVGRAQIQSLAVGTAEIDNLAVTDAKIGSLSVSKLLAGTISVAVSLTAPTILVTSGTLTINIDATNQIKVANSASSVTCYHTGDHFRAESSAGGFGQISPAQLIMHSPSGAEMSLTPGNMSFNSTQVLRERYTGSVTTTAQVISCLQYHGLCN